MGNGRGSVGDVWGTVGIGSPVGVVDSGRGISGLGGSSGDLGITCRG